MVDNYDKLCGILNEFGIVKTAFTKEAKISTNAMVKFGRNEDVWVGVLEKICLVLDCKLDDIESRKEYFFEYQLLIINIIRNLNDG